MPGAMIGKLLRIYAPLLVGLLAACDKRTEGVSEVKGPMRDSSLARAGSHPDDIVVIAGTSDSERPSLLLRALNTLKTSRLTLEYESLSILTTNLPLIAVRALRARTDSAFLLTVRLDADSVQQIGPELFMGRELPKDMKWLRLGRADGLFISYDEPLEGSIGTAIFRLNGRGLTQVYTDAENSCMPAQLRDLDNDGDLELVSYHGDRSLGYCGNDCYLLLRDRFGGIPNWPVVNKWNGSSWTPRQLNERYADWYRSLVDHFDSILVWVDNDPEAQRCMHFDWFGDGQIVRDLAAGARSLLGNAVRVQK